MDIEQLFDFIRSLNGDFAKYIGKGCASYLHILHKLNVRIELRNIDVFINKNILELQNDKELLSKQNEQIYNSILDRLKEFCKYNNCTYDIFFYNQIYRNVGEIHIIKNGVDSIPIIFYINEEQQENFETINGFNVINFENVLKSEKYNFRITSEIVSEFPIKNNENEDIYEELLKEYNMAVSNLSRRISVDNYLDQIKFLYT